MTNAPHGAFFGDDNSPSFAKERGPRILPIPEKARAEFQQKTTQNIDKRSIVCYNLCAKYEQHSAKLVLFGL
ncbi:MAG: hypothetical protein SPG74_05600, partial [Eubacteriales bacterium]|nr:hypothetical protein [Eubacteriales bacterium]